MATGPSRPTTELTAAPTYSFIMSSHAGTIDHHHDPSTSTGIPNKKLLMWAFLASDCMFFGSLIATHLIYRLHPPAGGLDPKVVFSPELTSFSTFILLMSSFLMALAVSAMHKGQVKSFRRNVLGVIFFGLIFKFPARPGVKGLYVSGEKASEKKWIAYPHYLVLVFDVIIVVAALRVWYDVKINMPPAEQTVRVIAQQWAWTFVHPGPDGKLDTTDDIRTVNELNLQVNTLYHYELHSKDVLHSFSVPAFRLKQDAVPGRAIRNC